MTTLQTKRLFLREFIDDDFPSLYEIFSDPEAMKFYPAPFSQEKTKEWIKNNQKRYKEDGFGLWAVCLQDTGECIGDCGLVKQQFIDRTEIEIGYHIQRKFWGYGYATEAASVCRTYGFKELEKDRFISIIKTGNIASVRVAEKIGMQKEREDYIFGNYYDIYSVLKNNEVKIDRDVKF
ncbi:GNAT family N-acetyltransferase [Caldibacillus lycopersici]|uniref:GNAT family N-acetyltransferase n=1 Tax=Perspicuibacillus lycopersici TaxID=1325689 RepID=A0AAE3IU80_9BACI|nr:GNAT family N-acetyltransferase [Perspicuibacillus lycopersici]MCU9614720.1 GNAT family N-acetyltransferase [Perspicuibacillus lycopersici]